MATLLVANPTLLDLAKMMDPDGKIATIIEILNQMNEVLDDMTWVEGNLPTGHVTTIRTGIPAPTWRKLYGGVQPNRATTRQVTDSCGELSAYAEIDKVLADLNGNTAAFRLQEDRAHLEGMAQELADTIFYGNETTEPEAFTGLAPRFNTLSASVPSSENVISGGGAGSDNTSIWLVVWSPQTVHGIIPKGMPAGLQMIDKGQVTIENADGAGGRMEAYRTFYQQFAGLCVRDWRYVVRIPNIDKSNLTKDATGSSADLIDLMTQAIELIPNLGVGRPVFYVSRLIRSILRRQISNATKNSTLSLETIGGKKVVMFNEIPVKRVDRLAADEAVVV
jgi:hypothetical protein